MTKLVVRPINIALVVVDIASRYKDAEPLQSKYANEVAKLSKDIQTRTIKISQINSS